MWETVTPRSGGLRCLEHTPPWTNCLTKHEKQRAEGGLPCSKPVPLASCYIIGLAGRGLRVGGFWWVGTGVNFASFKMALFWHLLA
jgi:hypothetical protein